MPDVAARPAGPLYRERFAVAVETEWRRRQQQRKQQEAPEPFGQWIDKLGDGKQWDALHFRAMQAVLDRVTSGEVHRAIFTVPIRHGKTEHNTYRYTAYRFQHQPRLRVLLASYNESQAQKFSRVTRRLVRSLGVALSDERDAVGEWETAAGGSYRAVGAGAGVASVNADLIVIDDPIGKRSDAESVAKREALWDWLTNDILARAEPHTAIILTASRYHTDDVTGRLLERQAGQWEHVHFPAIADADDPLNRPAGAPLWPELRPLEWLEEQKVTLGSYGFASLFQGAPRPREGGMFRWEWWDVLGDRPVCSRVIRYWDLAGTQPKDGKHDPDFSAGTLMGRMTDQRTCILHQDAFRLGVNARDAKLEAIARADKAAYPNVVWWLEKEAGIAGDERTAAIVRRIQALGITCYTERPTGSKIDRAEPLQSAAEAGNVCLAPDTSNGDGPGWHDAFRGEASDFPTGLHDDRVDSAAGAYNKLAQSRPTVVTNFRI